MHWKKFADEELCHASSETRWWYCSNSSKFVIMRSINSNINLPRTLMYIKECFEKLFIIHVQPLYCINIKWWMGTEFIFKSNLFQMKFSLGDAFELMVLIDTICARCPCMHECGDNHRRWKDAWRALALQDQNLIHLVIKKQWIPIKRWCN